MFCVGCGSDKNIDADNESLSAAQAQDNAEDDWEEDDLDEVETGVFTTDVSGQLESETAMCNLILTRVTNQPMATVMVSLDLFGQGCDITGKCEDPAMQSGELNYNGGIEGEGPLRTMSLSFEPASTNEDEPMWMFNAIYKTEPFNNFELLVDGQHFDLLSSDMPDAEDYAKGPHIWHTKILIEADMLHAVDTADQPESQVRGTFTYEGPCEINGKLMEL